MAKRKSERERFEDWMGVDALGYALDRTEYTDGTLGEYIEDETYVAWLAWVAAKRDAKRRNR